MTYAPTRTKNNQYPAEKYYSCYSPRVLTYLLNKGFKPYATFVNVKTLKTCYVFEKGLELNSAITEVSKR